MTDFGAFVTLGVRHIADFAAADHLLFLLVLGVIYRPRDWRAALVVVSAFTLGHSLTLGLATVGWLTPPSAWVEFLIPVTIVLTAAENLVREASHETRAATLRRAALTLVFGLVHGAGFAGYLRALMGQDILVPLLGFNVGVELGQLAILAAAAMLYAAMDAVSARQTVHAAVVFPWRVRAVSAAVLVIGLSWAVERWP